MSRLSVLLLVCVLSVLAFLVCGETIVSDNYGSQVGLPLSGGNATGGFTIANSLIRTSPYILSIFINDIIDNNPSNNQPYPGPDNESFQMLNVFGAGNLTSACFTPFIVISNTPVPNGPAVCSNPPASLLGPNSAMGAYVFTFSIPVNQTLTANITYNSTANPFVVDKIFISINNPILPNVVGDPQFIGLRGQSYQVHGVDGAVYNIISEKDTQVNSRFVFLSSGACPVIGGVTQLLNCWSHPGSYLGELSFQQRIAGKIQAGLVTAGAANKGFAAVQVNGRSLKVGDSVIISDSFSFNFTSTHTVEIATDHFSFSLSNSDLFINQAVRPRIALSKLTSHGLLGQTHASKIYSTATRYIEGNVDDYVIEDDDIFGTDFLYNQFSS